LEIEMEREQELNKLINVLRRIARLATHAQWMSAGESEARYGVSQFNKILARLGELDPNIKNVFEPLAEDSSLLTVAMASRQVVSYYEDEVRAPESDSKSWAWKVDEELGVGWFASDLGKKGSLRILAGYKPGGVDLEEVDNWVRDLECEWDGRDRERRTEHKRKG
jgi:hypothetical protein